MYQFSEARIEALLAEPVGKGEAIEILELCGAAKFDGDCEFAACAELREEIFEALKLVAIFRREADRGLDAFLPAAVEEKPLLRGEAEVALVPLAIFQDAEFFEQFADVFGFGTGHGNVMRGPGISGDFVFAPAGIAAGLRIHFEKDEIGEAALAQTPGRAQAGDAAADDDDGNFFDALRGGEKRRDRAAGGPSGRNR